MESAEWVHLKHIVNENKRRKGRTTQMIENRLKNERSRVLTEKAMSSKRDDKSARYGEGKRREDKAVNTAGGVSGKRGNNTAGKAGHKPETGKRPLQKGSNQKTGNNRDLRSGTSAFKRGISAKEEGHPVRKNTTPCPVFLRCGGCQLLDMPYDKQLSLKQKQLEELLKPYCRVQPIIGMKDPFHYRNKVHAVFDHDKKGNPVSGVYEANTHRVVPIESCLIEDQKADEIIGTIRGMLKSFKIKTFDEDTGYGLLRHVLIRRGFVTGDIMVVLVTASPVFPSKNNFVRALREKHPEITTIVQNINGRDTSMVLGDRENVLYGKGYIEDILCGFRFRISSKSFYQVNPVQTEVLYRKAIELAGLTGKETVIDAYCGIGTIGIVASQEADRVIGVELNRDAVRDAAQNAKINGIKNAQFYCNDAGAFMSKMADNGEHVDVVFMDPPRSGSTEEFIQSVAKIKPEKVVYVSCGPETLARDLGVFRKMGYEAKVAWGVDMFPQAAHVESVIMMQNCGFKKK
jgi:23S rRNA (uracil1939-C5)-methyltransferase